MVQLRQCLTPRGVTNPLNDLLGYHLRRAAGSMMADLAERLSTLELTLTEVSVLQLVDANTLITQSEIGRVISIKRANMTPLAAGLIARGLIARRAVDGRSQGLELTATGAACLETARLRMAENETLFLRRVPKARRAALLDTLRGMWDVGD